MSSARPDASKAGFFPSLRTRGRVIGALILRDIGTRHGNQLSAQFYHIAEPAVILLVILGFHFYGGGQTVPSPGISLAAFVLTGYPQHMLLRHTGVSGVSAILANKPLLYHQQVRYIDLVFSRLFLETALVIVGLFIIYIVLLWFKLINPPQSIAYFYLGWFFEIWVAFSICFIFTGLGQMSKLVRRLFIPFAFIMMPFYGIFMMAYWLPPNVRAFFLLSPPFDATEMIRRGYLGADIPTYFDVTYTVVACLALTFVGFALMQHARKNFVA